MSSFAPPFPISFAIRSFSHFHNQPVSWLRYLSNHILFLLPIPNVMTGFPYNSVGKKCKRPRSNSWVRKICSRRGRLVFLGFPCGSGGKNPPEMWETWVWSLGWKIPCKRERLLTPVFWPGEFHGPYIPWNYKESETTERTSLSLSFNVMTLIWTDSTSHLYDSDHFLTSYSTIISLKFSSHFKVLLQRWIIVLSARKPCLWIEN